MKQFITDEQIEMALNFIRDNAESLAKWKSRARYLEHHRKSVRANAFMKCSGSAALCKEQAEASDEYAKVLEEYEEAMYEFTLIEARMNAAQSKIDAWRTMASTLKMGNI